MTLNEPACSWSGSQSRLTMLFGCWEHQGNAEALLLASESWNCHPERFRIFMSLREAYSSNWHSCLKLSDNSFCLEFCEETLLGKVRTLVICLEMELDGTPSFTYRCNETTKGSDSGREWVLVSLQRCMNWVWLNMGDRSEIRIAARMM